LKVADIAMGSAAFLVAAARYLGDQLVDAWVRESDPRVADFAARSADRGPDADDDPVVVEARRQVIEHCLYGVDINPMAVEMAKLSLWLVSMDPQRPFTFLDDRLIAGDSLLGITSLDQLEYLHMDPQRGRELHEDIFGWSSGVRSLVAEIAAERTQIAGIELGDDPLAALARKRGLLADAELRARQLRLFADLAVGAVLAYAGKGDRGLAAGSIAAARLANDVASGKGEPAAWEQRKAWLATDQVDGAFDRDPLHWPLVFPEVFQWGGFDAIVGNPPFLGGKKISGTTGSAYREFLVDAIARGVKGSADLVAYFLLRAHVLLSPTGQAGIIATNTLSQGDTREVGLDQLVACGVTIRQAVKSEPWPSKSAVLEYCAVWTSRASLGGGSTCKVDDLIVSAVTPGLDPESRAVGNSKCLYGSGGIAFQGSIVVGLGFTLEPVEAFEIIGENQRNTEVLFPYLNGQDVSSRPDCTASRWIINFRDWSQGKAKRYHSCYERLSRLVRPEREKVRREAHRARWWRYGDYKPSLYAAITGLERVIVITLHAKTVMPVMVPREQVFSHGLAVFATDDTAMLALLSSAPHYWWALSRASTLETRVRYTPSDVFETLPLPELTQQMRELGDRLDTYRRNVMLSRQSGLTKTYNLVHDPACTDTDIAELRAIHTAIDEATVRAYGWDDMLDQLDHGFHPVGRETRYTIGPAAQREILDRLLELNHERYAEEVAAGLHDKKGRAAKRGAVGDQDGLFQT
jgi:hypothetical protein